MHIFDNFLPEAGPQLDFPHDPLLIKLLWGSAMISSPWWGLGQSPSHKHISVHLAVMFMVIFVPFSWFHLSVAEGFD